MDNLLLFSYIHYTKFPDLSQIVPRGTLRHWSPVGASPCGARKKVVHRAGVPLWITSPGVVDNLWKLWITTTVAEEISTGLWKTLWITCWGNYRPIRARCACFTSIWTVACASDHSPFTSSRAHKIGSRLSRISVSVILSRVMSLCVICVVFICSYYHHPRPISKRTHVRVQQLSPGRAGTNGATVKSYPQAGGCLWITLLGELLGVAGGD